MFCFPKRHKLLTRKLNLYYIQPPFGSMLQSLSKMLREERILAPSELKSFS